MSTLTQARPFLVDDKVTVTYDRPWRGRDINGEPGVIARDLGYGNGGRRAFDVKLGDGSTILLYADQIRLADES